MFIYCICTPYLVGAPFALITASIRRGMEVISLWHCWGGMEAQVSLIAAFSSSALLGLVSLWNLLSSEKRTLDHWATVQFFFSTAQVRRFWHCLWFRSGLVALFLKTSERDDSWCTDSSFSPLLVKLSQVFESALLDSILKLAVIPVACAHFPTQILPSSQLCINMLWYSTL